MEIAVTYLVTDFEDALAMNYLCSSLSCSVGKRVYIPSLFFPFFNLYPSKS